MRLRDLFFRRDAPERQAEVQRVSGAGDFRVAAPATSIACPFAQGARLPEKEGPVPVKVVIEDAAGDEQDVEVEVNEFLIRVPGHDKPFQHTRTKPDGTWVYTRCRR